MKVDIRATGFELTDAIRAHARRRVDFSLSRFENRITRVYVALSDLNGPKGGVDKSCKIRIDAEGRLRVIAQEADSDLYCAVDRATERAGRTLGREVARRTASRNRAAEFEPVAL